MEALALIAVVLLVTVILLALLLSHLRRNRKIISGSSSDGKVLSSRLPQPPRSLEVVGGAGKTKTQSSAKPWTSFDTWDTLREDSDAYRGYQQDVSDVLTSLDLDWSGVLTELSDKLHDNREWAGRINLVDGKPKIVELRPSPHAVGEGPLHKGSGAMVPPELMDEIGRTPAMFRFHTHPGEIGTSLMPSDLDIAEAAWIAYTGEFAADLMISPYGVFMYTPNMKFRLEVWKDPHDGRQAELTMLRKVSDILGALGGKRSWNSPWHISDLIDMLKRYQMEYIVFPTDKYQGPSNRWGFAEPEDASWEGEIAKYTSRIHKIEREIEEENSKKTVV